MNQYIKSYEIVLHTLSPIHIGSGKKLDKKEYIFLKKKKKVYIPDWQKMYAGMQKKYLEKTFTEFFLLNQDKMRYDQRQTLGDWMYKNRISEHEYAAWMAYELDCGDFLESKGQIEISTFMKDGYNLPFVPGSSIKGMLRTILFGYELFNHPSIKRSRQVTDAVENNDFRLRRDKFLLKENREMENEIFHILNRKDEKGTPVKFSDAVNDCLSGMIIGDSAPLKTSDLVLCQKIDENIEGESHSLPILRECIKPGVDIHFQLTIDSSICPYSIEDILRAINQFQEFYYKVHLSHFTYADYPEENTVWLGGGTGFLTKTVTYALLGEKKGVETTVAIFDKTLSRKANQEHKHYKDIKLHVSPHVLKCTKYQGKRYQMGLCKFQILKKL